MEVRNSKVIAINNQKGGQGKSTISHHLGVVFAESDLKTCVIDCDYTQGSLTSMMVGSVEGTDQKGIMHVMLDDKTQAHEVLMRTKIKNLDMIPTEVKVMNRSINIELVIAQDPDRDSKLKKFINENLRGEYDIIIIDTPPKDDLVLRNALVASDYAIIPTKPGDADTAMVPKAATTIIDVKQGSNPDIDLLGVILFETDGRAKITREARERIKGIIGDGVFNTEIRKNTKFTSLMRDQKSIFDVIEKKSDKGALEYYNLGFEILERLGLQRVETAQEVLSE